MSPIGSFPLYVISWMQTPHNGLIILSGRVGRKKVVFLIFILASSELTVGKFRSHNLRAVKANGYGGTDKDRAFKFLR